MQNALQVTFEGCEPSDLVRAEIEREFAQLEIQDHRITAGRVTVIGPGERHRYGAGFLIHILLTMPPHENVVVGRGAADERHHEFADAAVKDAFAVARRRIDEFRQG